MSSMFVVHNGGLSNRAIAVQLRQAELSGDMDRYQALLRVPPPEHQIVHVFGDSLVMMFETLQLSMPQETLSTFVDVFPERHYRDLEYPHRSNRSRLKEVRGKLQVRKR